MKNVLRATPMPMRLVIGVLFVVGVSGLFGCKGEVASSAPRPIPEVQVVQVTTQTVPDEPEFIGQAEASSMAWTRKSGGKR
ncbi:MAG: hypothetical protein CV088_05185 [Nitrospira sp. LK70]|nr:hypothetical protein [Nitrospira sp. LK70]